MLLNILKSFSLVSTALGDTRYVRIGDRDIPVYDKPDGCDCKARIEYVHVQDMSQSFKRILSHWKQYSNDFVEALNSLYPDAKYGMALHVDKPLPMLGYGWGDFHTKLFEKDYCYKRHMPFGDKNKLLKAINELPTPSGGNDLPENQFGAIINSVYDPQFKWTSGDVDSDGTIVVKVLSLMTDSVAHGLKAAGQKKKSGGVWPDHPTGTRGWALWWATQYWDYSYGRELAARDPSNNSYSSWIWPTSNQFSFSNMCTYETGILTDYEILGDKLITKRNTLTPEEEKRWEKVKKHCGPSNIYEYMGVADAEQLAGNLHDGKFLPESGCLNTEYPNQQQVVDALKEKNIIPLIIVPAVEATATINATTKYYKFVYGCNKDTEGGCVEEFYRDAFDGHNIETVTPNMQNGDSLDWMGSLFDMIRAAVNKSCDCSTTTTTSTTTSKSNSERMTDRYITTTGITTTKNITSTKSITSTTEVTDVTSTTEMKDVTSTTEMKDVTSTTDETLATDETDMAEGTDMADETDIDGTEIMEEIDVLLTTDPASAKGNSTTARQPVIDSETDIIDIIDGTEIMEGIDEKEIDEEDEKNIDGEDEKIIDEEDETDIDGTEIMEGIDVLLTTDPASAKGNSTTARQPVIDSETDIIDIIDGTEIMEGIDEKETDEEDEINIDEENEEKNIDEEDEENIDEEDETDIDEEDEKIIDEEDETDIDGTENMEGIDVLLTTDPASAKGKSTTARQPVIDSETDIIDIIDGTEIMEGIDEKEINEEDEKNIDGEDEKIIDEEDETDIDGTEIMEGIDVLLTTDPASAKGNSTTARQPVIDSDSTSKDSTSCSKPVCDIKEWITYPCMQEWKNLNVDIDLNDILFRVRPGKCEDCVCECNQKSKKLL